MPTPVRLTSSENRAWSANVPQLVNNKGVPIQAVTPELEKQCSQLMLQASRQEKSIKKKVRFTERDETGRETPRELTIEARVKRLGKQRGNVKTFCFVEGMLKVSTRDIIQARIFKKHGECMLLRINGKFLKIIRDPNRPQSSVVASQEHTRHAPSPENCICREWGEPHPGKHHAICQYNMMAPEDERGLAPGEDSPGHPMRRQRLPKGVTLVKPPEAPKPVPSPEECECKEWERPDPTKHHPICRHKTAWETKSENRPVFFLVSLDTGEVVREASLDEAAKAEIEEERTGQKLIEINQAVYAVLTKEELPSSESAVDDVEEVINESGEVVDAPVTARGADLEDSIYMAGADGSDTGDEATETEEPEPDPIRGHGLNPELDDGGLELPGMDLAEDAEPAN